MPVDLTKRSADQLPTPSDSVPNRLRLFAGLVVLLVAGIAAVIIIGKGSDQPTAPQRGSAAKQQAASGPGSQVVDTFHADRTVVAHGLTFSVPRERWSLGSRRRANEGRQIIRELSGPAGQKVILVHTPRFRAQPDPSTIVDRRRLDLPDVVDARLLVLKGFPTDACSDRRCDDFVLNDPSFGGLAILASDSGGSASMVALRIARSVRPSRD